MKRTIQRRDFIKTIGAATIGLGFGVSIFDGVVQSAQALTDRERHDLFMKGTVDFMGFKAREITPNSDFYITTYSDDTPSINPETFVLRVEGQVQNPYRLTMKDLEAMKDKEEFVTLECIGNPVGGSAIGNALWEGVTLNKIIQEAKPKNGLVKTVFYAEDGYSDSIPYPLALSDDVFVAFKMNGEDLPKVHGFPLRAIVPGIFGMKNVKWLSKIEVVDSDYQGYWEKKGWSDSSVIPVMSEILMPMDGKKIPAGGYVIGGIAFGGRHGISRVQVSLDDGKSWHDAAVKKSLSPWAWSLWSYQWNPVEKKEYTIKARAFDRSGRVQESKSKRTSFFRSRSYPDGARGIDSVTARVE
jgi:DMSO/TMAO reductase YedYZ molybdopterin-dependent catalytic subunit